MTNEEAMRQAKDSMSDEDLKRFRLTRGEWEEGIDWLADYYGIYPDNDPRNKGRFLNFNDTYIWKLSEIKERYLV